MAGTIKWNHVIVSGIFVMSASTRNPELPDFGFSIPRISSSIHVRHPSSFADRASADRVSHPAVSPADLGLQGDRYSAHPLHSELGLCLVTVKESCAN